MSASKKKDTSHVMVIRQDRYQIEDLRSYFEIDGRPQRVINYSTFGIAIEARTTFHVGAKFTGYLKVERVEICALHVRVVRVEPGDDSSRVAFEVIDGQIDTERVSAILESIRAISTLKTQADHFAPLPQEYKYNVYELQDYIQRIEKKVNEFESQRNALSANGREAFEKAIIDVVAPPARCHSRLQRPPQ